MFRVLLRLYLITIVTYSAAIFLIPKLVIQVFEHRYVDYNVEQSRGLQKLISLLVPSEQRQFVREALYGCYRYSNEFDQACSSVWWEKALSNAEERLKRPLSTSELQAWLASTPLRLMAGRHYQTLCDHLSKHLQTR